MSKAFTKETDNDTDDELEQPDALPAHVKNYMTPTGVAAMQKEFHLLQTVERPKVVEVVAWAASNGDRSENGDYIYGKKRLREIDRRMRYITKQLERAVVVDPAQQQGLEQVFFGATVTYAKADDTEHTVQLVGVDETDINAGKISWLSPVAKALMKAKVDDVVKVKTPSGLEQLEVLEITYPI